MPLRVLVLLLLILSACTTSSYNVVVTASYGPELIKQKLKLSASAIKKKKDGDKHEFKLYVNRSVRKWVHYFTKKDRKRFTRFITKGYYYQEMIKTILEEEEVPHVLFYLPLIESGFNTVAHSRAGAVGPWQFVKGTATRYGLMVNKSVDERRDPILSTEAGARYLTDLYNVFNSWELAIAAYNCGEIRVLRAIMKGKTRNFWKLAKMKLLPRETREYVPKFLAAARIGENLRRYGIKVRSKKRYPDVESYTFPGGMTLRKIARTIGHPYKKLLNLNPALKTNRTPSSLKNYSLWLYPKYYKKLKQSKRVLTKKKRRRGLKESPVYYRVRNGDTLIGVAKKFRISLNKIRRINGITGSKILKGQRLVVRSKSYARVKGRRFYFIRKGDFLGRVARRYRVSVSYLRKLNGLLSSRLYVGQKLDVTKGVKKFKYRVRRGDNLIAIAHLYRTSVRKITKKNSIRSNQIYIGQILKI